MKVPFLDLKRQYSSLKDEIDAAIKDSIDNCGFILGKHVTEFEKNFAKFCNVKFCVGVNSGTSALRLALMATGIKSGDEVITAPNTFIATAEAISHVNAKPVFVDIDTDSYNFDVTKIEKAITKKTKAIIPVHLYGQPADMDPILEIAKKRNLKIIEDACQAHGAEYKGKKIGSVSDVACFSFYPGKNLGAYGEGGAVVTKDIEVMEKINILRDHGQKSKGQHILIGDNCRLEGIQGAVLNVKLKYLEEATENRRKNAKLYSELLSGLDVKTPKEMDYSKHVYHIYAVLSEKREKLMEHLKNNGIFTGIHYPTPIHLQEAYSYLGLKKGSFEVSETFAEKTLSLPMFPELTGEEINFVADKIKEFNSQILK